MTDRRPPRKPIRPLVAWRALRALLRDPDDTTQVFRIIDAISGNSGERQFRRFRSSELGRAVLSERRVLLERLLDVGALRALPEGSLGRSYAAFMGVEQLSADGLVGASEEIRRDEEYFDADRRLYGERLRDMHDLWHVATGYGRDLIGEAALLGFTFAQTRNPGVGLIVATALFKLRRAPEARRLVWSGVKRGWRAAWLPAADWEALLARPLDQVRSELRLGLPPRYAAERSAAAPQLAGT